MGRLRLLLPKKARGGRKVGLPRYARWCHRNHHVNGFVAASGAPLIVDVPVVSSSILVVTNLVAVVISIALFPTDFATV